MAHHLYWYDEEDGILQIDVEGATSWDRFHDVIDSVVETLKTAPGDRVDVIFNSSAKMPKGNPIPHIQRTHRDLSRQEKMGLLVIVNQNHSAEMQILKVMVDIVLRTAGIVVPKMRLIVHTQEEALKLIYADREAGEDSVSSAVHRRGRVPSL